MAGPIFTPLGNLVGILSNNVIVDSSGANIAYVRNGNIFSFDSLYLGRIVKVRGKMIWSRY